MIEPVQQTDVPFGSAGTELASHRTALAMERTRMAADRTLMASLRTSLALIGFGFTIVKFFNEVGKQLAIQGAMASPARNFGITLVVLGVALLIASLYNHWQFTVGQRLLRDDLFARHLLGSSSRHRTSATAMICVLLLLAGLLVLLGILARTGPFQIIG